MSHFAVPIAIGAVAVVLLRPHQHDARRFAEQVAEADAAARSFAIHRHRPHHAHGLGDGAVSARRQTTRRVEWRSATGTAGCHCASPAAPLCSQRAEGGRVRIWYLSSNISKVWMAVAIAYFAAIASAKSADLTPSAAPWYSAAWFAENDLSQSFEVRFGEYVHGIGSVERYPRHQRLDRDAPAELRCDGLLDLLSPPAAGWAATTTSRAGPASPISISYIRCRSRSGCFSSRSSAVPFTMAV